MNDKLYIPITFSILFIYFHTISILQYNYVTLLSVHFLLILKTALFHVLSNAICIYKLTRIFSQVWLIVTTPFIFYWCKRKHLIGKNCAFLKKKKKETENIPFYSDAIFYNDVQLETYSLTVIETDVNNIYLFLTPYNYFFPSFPFFFYSTYIYRSLIAVFFYRRYLFLNQSERFVLR